MFGVWRIEIERPARWWRYYHCAATATENGDEYRLVCEWVQPLYVLNVTSASRGPDAPLLTSLLFSDADCGRYVRQVMRIARSDVARRLARLDRLRGALNIDLDAACKIAERKRPR